jgi:hypothetical protein
MNARTTRAVRALGAAPLCALGALACAASPGDELACPDCDNVTELLVGNKCVPIAEVERCGPDGHAHGDECHCFNGQAPTLIGGVEYCLQQGCAGGDPMVDIDAAACGHLTDMAEHVVAVSVFADFPNAHVDLDTLAEVHLPAGVASYVHFPGMATGHVLAYLDTAGVFTGAWNQTQQPLEVESLGANSACAGDWVEVWEIQVHNDTGSVAPQIIELAAGTRAAVRLVLLAEQE